MERYEKLEVWKEAYQITLEVYKVTRSFPKEEFYVMVPQIRRAACSVVANIAEGSARGSRKEFVQFLHIASGSLSELETFLRLSKDLGYFPSADYQHFQQTITQLTRKMSALIASEKSRTKSPYLLSVLASSASLASFASLASLASVASLAFL